MDKGSIRFCQGRSPQRFDVAQPLSTLSTAPSPRSGSARIVFDCRTTNHPATMNKESTNENNTDVDCWVDARRLRINGKPCSQSYSCTGSAIRIRRCCGGGHNMRLPLTIKPRRCLNLPPRSTDRTRIAFTVEWEPK